MSSEGATADTSDDPFMVVRPEDDNKRMSTYFKKQQLPTPAKCAETGSHGTTSTKSTSASASTTASAPASLRKQRRRKRRTTSQSGAVPASASGREDDSHGTSETHDDDDDDDHDGSFSESATESHNGSAASLNFIREEPTTEGATGTDSAAGERRKQRRSRRHQHDGTPLPSTSPSTLRKERRSGRSRSAKARSRSGKGQTSTPSEGTSTGTSRSSHRHKSNVSRHERTSSDAFPTGPQVDDFTMDIDPFSDDPFTGSDPFQDFNSSQDSFVLDGLDTADDFAESARNGNGNGNDPFGGDAFFDNGNGNTQSFASFDDEEAFALSADTSGPDRSQDKTAAWEMREAWKRGQEQGQSRGSVQAKHKSTGRRHSARRHGSGSQNRPARRHSSDDFTVESSTSDRSRRSRRSIDSVDANRTRPRRRATMDNLNSGSVNGENGSGDMDADADSGSRRQQRTRPGRVPLTSNQRPPRRASMSMSGSGVPVSSGVPPAAAPRSRPPRRVPPSRNRSMDGALFELQGMSSAKAPTGRGRRSGRRASLGVQSSSVSTAADPSAMQLNYPKPSTSTSSRSSDVQLPQKETSRGQQRMSEFHHFGESSLSSFSTDDLRKPDSASRLGMSIGDLGASSMVVGKSGGSETDSRRRAPRRGSLAGLIPRKKTDKKPEEPGYDPRSAQGRDQRSLLDRIGDDV